jgi:hypothetical protein
VSDSDIPESFGRGVLACVADLNTKVLPHLTRRYDSLVVVTALAEHIGSALRILIRNKVCEPEEARAVIERVRATAFLRQTLRETARTKKTRGTPPDTPPK